ncbi:MAG: peptidoglycan editing factor PgeF [Bacteroidota bacterium]
MLYIQPNTFAEEPHVVAGFSTRQGGVSGPPFHSLNLGLSTADHSDDVHENRKRLFERAGFSVDQLAITGQVHGTEVLDVDAPGLYVGYDGMVTRAPNLLLCLSAADCASVLIADPVNRVIGACHAGWRGTVGRITVKTVERMLAHGAALENLKAYVSPCISASQFEVGPEVASQFAPAFVCSIPGKEKPHVDLKKALQFQLLEVGIQENAIEISPHCTFTETDRFFSHRAEHGKTGRLMGFIGLKT